MTARSTIPLIKPFKVGDGIVLIECEHEYVLVVDQTKLAKAALKVVKERHEGSEWDVLSEAIGELSDALEDAGYEPAGRG